MSNSDFRVLCAELLTALDCYMMMDGRDTTPAAERSAQLMEAKRKCIAALAAEPAPAPKGGPSDVEVIPLIAEALNQSIQEVEESMEDGFPFEVTGLELANFARAVLARYGTTNLPDAQP